MSKDNTTKADNDISQLGNVDQIREILFGSQSRELNERFEKIETSIKSLHDEMRSKLELSQNDFEDRINNEIETVSKKMKNITTQQQDDFTDVRDASVKLEKRIQSSMEIMEDELNSKREQLQKQQLEMRNSLRSQMDALQDEILTVLNTKFSEISEVKLSRNDAADIFMEAAMSMKGTNINQQLSLTPTEAK